MQFFPLAHLLTAAVIFFKVSCVCHSLNGYIILTDMFNMYSNILLGKTVLNCEALRLNDTLSITGTEKHHLFKAVKGLEGAENMTGCRS